MSACACLSSSMCTRPSSGLLLPWTSADSRDSMLMAGVPSRSAKPEVFVVFVLNEAEQQHHV